MARVKLTLTGMEKLQNALKNAPEVARSHASSAIAASTFAVAQRARSLVPVDTGTLRNAIESNRPNVKGLVGRVGLNSSAARGYWFFVEFGTRYMPARPFFRTAAELEREALIQRMRLIGPQIERDLSAGRLL